MDIELSTSQNYSSTYQVVPGELSKKKLLVATTTAGSMASRDDIEGGGLIHDHAASVEDNLRYRTRSSEIESSPPRPSSPSTASGADEFIDIKVSFSGYLYVPCGVRKVTGENESTCIG